MRFMGYHYYSDSALFNQVAQDPHDFVASVSVKSTCRLVGQYHLGINHQRPSYRHTLLFPTGHLIGAMVKTVS